MRRLLLAAALAFTVALGGCAQVQKVMEVATATVTNPVSQTDVYRAKTVYAATLQAVVEYRDYCWSKPYAVLMADPVAAPICQHRRKIVREAQRARPQVAAAIRVAENFVRDNPTLNASAAIAAMWKAVNDFKALVPAFN
jgi:hypothetical protein